MLQSTLLQSGGDAREAAAPPSLVVEQLQQQAQAQATAVGECCCADRLCPQPIHPIFIAITAIAAIAATAATNATASAAVVVKTSAGDVGNSSVGRREASNL